MPTPSAVVFDNDGLLLDTEEAWTRAEETLFTGLGREFTVEHKRTLIGSSRSLAATKLETILERPGDGEALMDELHELVMEEALKGVAPRPGAVELLARLTDAGILLAVASNSERAFLERTLGGAGLLHGGPSRRSSRQTTSSSQSRHLTSISRRARGSASRRGTRPPSRTRRSASPRRQQPGCS
jgi:beta-phosphoglucomutase-like phosphatase (HAD superfamily)